MEIFIRTAMIKTQHITIQYCIFIATILFFHLFFIFIVFFFVIFRFESVFVSQFSYLLTLSTNSSLGEFTLRIFTLINSRNAITGVCLKNRRCENQKFIKQLIYSTKNIICIDKNWEFSIVLISFLTKNANWSKQRRKKWNHEKRWIRIKQTMNELRTKTMKKKWKWLK